MDLIQCCKCCQPIALNSARSAKIQCNICKKNFHNYCVAMSKHAHAYIEETAGCLWNCTDCTPMAIKLTEIATIVQNLEVTIQSQAKIISSQNEMLGEIKKKLNDPNLKSFQINDVTNTSKKRKYNEIVIGDWSDEMSTPVTHLNHTDKRTKSARKLCKEKREYDPVLIIKSKESDKDINVLKSEIQKIINPKDDPVNMIRTTNNGNLILRCNNQESVVNMKTKLDSILKEKCEIEEPKEVNPEVKLVGLETELSASEIKDQLIKRNPNVFIENSTLTVKCCKKIQLVKTTYYTVYIETDFETFKRIMSKGKVYLMWNALKCYQVLKDGRCYKCHEFNHMIKDCTAAEQICPKCAENHAFNVCKSDKFKCINCCRANEKYQVNLNTDHPVYSEECEVLRKRQSKIRKNIRYVQ